MSSFNPADVIVTVDGVAITGYADGTDVIDVDYDTDFVDAQVGVTGEAAFIERNDKRATIILKLLATALDNDVMSALVNAGTEIIVTMTDTGGNSVGAGQACRVQKPAQQQFGNEVGMREWRIRTLEWVEHVGGAAA